MTDASMAAQAARAWQPPPAPVQPPVGMAAILGSLRPLYLAPSAVRLPLAPVGSPFAWRPSRLRTIRLQGFPGPAERGATEPPLPLVWPNHPAGSVLDYSIRVPWEWGAPISAAALAVPAALELRAIVLTPGSSPRAGWLVTFWLAGGVAGQPGQFALSIATPTRGWRGAVSLFCR